jgi:hypothetical protein
MISALPKALFASRIMTNFTTSFDAENSQLLTFICDTLMAVQIWVNIVIVIVLAVIWKCCPSCAQKITNFWICLDRVTRDRPIVKTLKKKSCMFSPESHRNHTDVKNSMEDASMKNSEEDKPKSPKPSLTYVVAQQVQAAPETSPARKPMVPVENIPRKEQQTESILNSSVKERSAQDSVVQKSDPLTQKLAQKRIDPEEEYQKDLEIALIRSESESLVNSEEEYRINLNAALIESGGEPTLDFFIKEDGLTEEDSLIYFNIALEESKKNPIWLGMELLNCRNEIYEEAALKASRSELIKNSKKIRVFIMDMDISIWKYIIALITDLDLFSLSLVSKDLKNIIKKSGIELDSHIGRDPITKEYDYSIQTIIIIHNGSVVYTTYYRLLFLKAIGQYESW